MSSNCCLLKTFAFPRKLLFWTTLPLQMGQVGCTETSANYQHTLRKFQNNEDLIYTVARALDHARSLLFNLLSKITQAFRICTMCATCWTYFITLWLLLWFEDEMKNETP
jgi:hypothetical protein